ncbi:MAG: PGRS family protein [Polyangiaceae bacterium]
MRVAAGSALLLVSGAIGIAGCFFNDLDDCRLNPMLACYEGSGTGGSGGTGGTTVSPTCIPNQTGDPIEDGCGVFVSASKGKDSNDGETKAAPVATLTKAIEIAKGQPIYICADAKPLDDVLVVGDNVQIFGGLDCGSWKYVAGTKTKWTAGADEIPLHVKPNGSVALADVALEAASATKDGGSSIAILAEGTASLDLRRCDVIAGDGKAGPTPNAPSGTGTPGMPGNLGQAGCVDMTTKVGADGGQLACDGTDVSGGAGGNGTKTAAGGAGSPGVPLAPDTGKAGLGQGVAMSCDVDGKGGDGVEGLPGDPGAGATGNGVLSSSGYTGENGKDGASAGTPGQGGGGGGGAEKCSNNNAGPSAGGGGSGGCGGATGKGGGPGGASIGIVSLGAALTLSDVTITTHFGGNGGDGGPGQPGGDGGAGGTPGSNNGDATGAACAGGKGGKGGTGGRGGGGLGGPSIGIAFTGEAPDTKGATIAPGSAGDGGQGDGGNGAGAKGITAPTQAF